MSGQSFMEQLLDGSTVDWLPLKNVLATERGKRLVKSQLEETGEFAVFQNSMTPLGYYHESNVEPESVFIICAGAAGEIGYNDSAFWAADDVYFFRHSEKVLSKYLYHWLLTQKEKISGQVRRASIPRLSKAVVEQLVFPVPCPENPTKSLAIQAEIVRILDAFSALTTELTKELAAEINARKKQYNYYCAKMLSFENDHVEWRTLDSLCNFVSSGTNKKRSIEGKYPVFGSTGVIAQTDEYAHEGKQILVARVGANAGYVHIADGKYDVSDNTIIVNVRENYSIKFIFYILTEMNLRQYAKGGGQPLITSGELKKLRIPIPHAANYKRSIAEQARIVDVLDKFNALTTSISECLPREIELRQKQYEYYRDLLLSFPKPEGMAA
jgi:type I restriction enzyme S subunit